MVKKVLMAENELSASHQLKYLQAPVKSRVKIILALCSTFSWSSCFPGTAVIVIAFSVCV